MQTIIKLDTGEIQVETHKANSGGLTTYASYCTISDCDGVQILTFNSSDFYKVYTRSNLRATKGNIEKQHNSVIANQAGILADYANHKRKVWQ